MSKNRSRNPKPKIQSHNQTCNFSFWEGSNLKAKLHLSRSLTLVNNPPPRYPRRGGIDALVF